jgi:hypothetical protein
MYAIALSPTTTTPVEVAELRDSVGSEYKAFTPLYDRFGITQTKDERVNRNLSVIWDWAAARSEVKDKDAILWEITKLENKIGSSTSGNAPYSKMLLYISEFNRMREAENRIKEMEHERA